MILKDRQENGPSDVDVKVWSSGKFPEEILRKPPTPPYCIFLNQDGNVCVSDSTQDPVLGEVCTWCSYSAQPGSNAQQRKFTLELMDDGIAVLTDDNNIVLWSSKVG